MLKLVVYLVRYIWNILLRENPIGKILEDVVFEIFNYQRCRAFIDRLDPIVQNDLNNLNLDTRENRPVAMIFRNEWFEDEVFDEKSWICGSRKILQVHFPRTG